MKKILFSLALIFCFCVNTNAQFRVQRNSKATSGEEQTEAPVATLSTTTGNESSASTSSTADAFEGEIVYETFENYSEYINRMPNSIYVDGVHKMRLIVKGNKMHLIDETTQCHTVVDGGYTHYCDLTKTGFSLSHYDYMLAAAPRTLDYGTMGQVAPLTSNTFAKTDQTSTILDKECTLWQGDIIHDMGGMSQKYTCHAYCTDIKAPAAYPIHLLGMPLETIAAKWIMKYDGGHVSIMKVGELSFYQEGDVISINPRTVSDDEFALPSTYKIKKGSIKSVFKMIAYYKGVKKALEKAGIKGGDASAKTTGVHYKTQEEWDF